MAKIPNKYILTIIAGERQEKGQKKEWKEEESLYHLQNMTKKDTEMKKSVQRNISWKRLAMRMKNKFIVFVLLLLGIFLVSCDKKIEKIEESKFLFGTYIKIIVYSDNKEKAMKSIEKAFNEIQRIDEKYNSKSEGSLIYNLNNSDNKRKIR